MRLHNPLLQNLAVKTRLSPGVLEESVAALRECEEAVTVCAAAMLTEGEPEQMREAVSRDVDCADVLTATRRVLARAGGGDVGVLAAQLNACAVACERSNELCSQHADHLEHCRVCAEATGKAAEACRRIMAGVTSA
ncbi:hypothetical protein [Streptomyces sp. MST-110588]|uniref:hypothetical protein n=1 Tax=Streptomyces sp. MST-110588 TaxID=2833628 RepID=UPI001F5C50F0|nr:hypothetical protein [Streptomyces sp. MST-110588]UNO42283.1 hypothetical protein KGS77_25620 [Streptomyces sp. MST-110588]